MSIIKNSLLALGLSLPFTTAAVLGQHQAPRIESAKQLAYKLPDGAAALFSRSYLTTRYRFIDKFFFEGAVAEEHVPSQKVIKFSDQTATMGQALLAFALESRILAEHGLPTAHTDLIIQHILQEFERLDLGPYESQLFDGESQPGFFLRDGVENNNRHQVPEDWEIISDLNSSLYTPGTPQSQSAMSNDQTISLLLGWWAVTNWTQNAENINLARTQATRVMDYLLWTEFQLKLPNGQPIASHRGPDMRLSSVSVTRMADLITGNNYFNRGKVEFKVGSLPLRLKVSDLHSAMKPIDGFARDALTKDKVSLKLPLAGEVFSFDVKPYSRNLMLIGLAFERSLGDAEYVNLAFDTGHYLGGLLRLAMNQKQAKVELSAEQIAHVREAFETYPQGGPSDSPEKGKWSTVYRWSRVPSLDGDGTHFYNGLDYMGLEGLMIATKLMEVNEIRELNRQALMEFSRKNLGRELSANELGAALALIEAQSWNAAKNYLFDLRTTELYQEIWGQTYTPTIEQLEEGRTYAGKFEELKKVINERYTSVIVTVIINGLILN